MRKLLSIVVVLLSVVGFLTAHGGMQDPSTAEQPQADKKIIDLKSDLSGPISAGDSVIFLVGNFAAQHNGAVITCDSAVRYSDRRIEFFGNVLINKNTTYIYGDRADYNGDLNEARVYSDIIKVVDGDAILYTYKFSFNTKTNIGVFDQGGVMINGDNVLEAVRGFFYSDQKDMIGVESVEMRNDEYELKGDSVIYNIDTDHAKFFERTNIWSSGGDYLYADRGTYSKVDSLYTVTRNGYVLTEKQEVWGDSIDYYRTQEHLIMRSDIQIDDTDHKVLAFGDYGEYWKFPGNAILTRRPSMVSYDAEQGDSLFMRADSMFLFTRRVGDDTPLTDSLSTSNQGESQGDNVAPPRQQAPVGSLPADSLSTDDSPFDLLDASAPDSTGRRLVIDSLGNRFRVDSLGHRTAVDSLDRTIVVDSLSSDTVKLTRAQLKAKLREKADKEKNDQRIAKAKAKKEKLAEVAAIRKEKQATKLLKYTQKEEIRLAAQKVKEESKIKARRARAARKRKPIHIDSVAVHRIDSLLSINAAMQDSLMSLLTDSLFRPASPSDSLSGDLIDSLAVPVDSIYRLIMGYRNVKIYRSDFQGVSDSMLAISTDSTIHLYINPVLWNGANQVTSDVMDIFTKNQELVKADFVGTPMMVSGLDTTHFNQVAGKSMTSYFHNNEIFRNDVKGNAQTIYYMEDGEPSKIVMMGVIESADISFYIEDKQLVQITYRGNPVYSFYPMDKIPADQDTRLKGFKWEIARKPTQADVFDRKVRPSERVHRSELHHPDFPIRQRIDHHRKRLIELRSWSDRHDQVDPATIDWMRDLGFEVGQPRE